MKDATGHEIVRATSTSSGTWTALVPPGTYTISAQPVGGLMGTPPTTTVTVIAGAHPEDVDLSYDTGIR